MNEDAKPEASEGEAVHLGGKIDESIAQRNPALVDSALLEGAVGKLEALAESMERDGPFLASSAHEDSEAGVAAEEAEPDMDVSDIDAAIFLHDPEADPDPDVGPGSADRQAPPGDADEKEPVRGMEPGPGDADLRHAADIDALDGTPGDDPDEDGPPVDLAHDGEPDEVYLLRVAEEEFAASIMRGREEVSETASSLEMQAAKDESVEQVATDDGRAGPSPAGHESEGGEAGDQPDGEDASFSRHSDAERAVGERSAPFQDTPAEQRAGHEDPDSILATGQRRTDRDEERPTAGLDLSGKETEGSAADALFGPEATPGSTVFRDEDVDPADGGAATVPSDLEAVSDQAGAKAPPGDAGHVEASGQASMEAATTENDGKPRDAQGGSSRGPFQESGVDADAGVEADIAERNEVRPDAWRRRVWWHISVMTCVGAAIILGALAVSWAVSTGRVVPGRILDQTMGKVEALLGNAGGTEIATEASATGPDVQAVETLDPAPPNRKRPDAGREEPSAAPAEGDVAAVPAADTGSVTPDVDGAPFVAAMPDAPAGYGQVEQGAVDPVLDDPVAELAKQIEERLTPTPRVADPVDVRRVIVIEEDIAAINARLDRMAAALEKDEAYRADIDERFSLMSGRLDRMDTSLAAVSVSLAQYAALDMEMEKVRTVLLDLAERMAEVEARNPADREATAAAIKELRLDLDRLVTNTAVIARMLSSGTVIDPSNDFFVPGDVTTVSPPRRDAHGAGFDPVPDDARKGDYVEGWGYVLDVVPAENGQTLVILENGSVFK